MYLYVAHKFKVNITHRFLEKGHTQNENDSVHALIEKCAQKKTIYVPEQWYALVRWAKETGEPYIVKEATTKDFYDFKVLLSGKNWNKNENKQKVYLSKMRDVKVNFDEPDIFYYKTDFDEPYNRIFISRSSKRDAKR